MPIYIKYIAACKSLQHVTYVYIYYPCSLFKFSFFPSSSLGCCCSGATLRSSPKVETFLHCKHRSSSPPAQSRILCLFCPPTIHYYSQHSLKSLVGSLLYAGELTTRHQSQLWHTVCCPMHGQYDAGLPARTVNGKLYREIVVYLYHVGRSTMVTNQK